MVATAEAIGRSTADLRTDLRIAFALRPHIRAWRVAQRVGVNPVILSRVLNGGRGVDADLALRIHRAILEEDAGASRGG